MAVPYHTLPPGIRTVRQLYLTTPLGRVLFAPLKWVYDVFRFRVLPDNVYTRMTFRKFLGYELNLDNPRTLNEKIQWLKRYDHNELQAVCADKFAVRQYVSRKLGPRYLVPLYSVLGSANELQPERLPDGPFIIKASHNSGGAVIVRDKRDIDWPLVQKKFRKILRTNYYHVNKEKQYRNIRPRLIVEKLLQDEQGEIPLDYKLHCFNGRLQMIQVDIDRHTDHKRNFYDPDWRLLPFTWKIAAGGGVKRPPHLAEMRALAEKIARDFTYVRADFYDVGSRVYFGEITFHPGSGFEAFRPVEWDRRLGDMLSLN